MESELSGIFRVQLVTKNIVRGSPGTQFMHMRVKRINKYKLKLKSKPWITLGLQKSICEKQITYNFY